MQTRRKIFIEANLNELEEDINQLKEESRDIVIREQGHRKSGNWLEIPTNTTESRQQELINYAKSELAYSLLYHSISLQFLEFMNNYYKKTCKRAKVI
jgi:hypothetical protein